MKAVYMMDKWGLISYNLYSKYSPACDYGDEEGRTNYTTPYNILS